MVELILIDTSVDGRMRYLPMRTRHSGGGQQTRLDHDPAAYELGRTCQNIRPSG
jgi:hypothetical protein